MGRLRVKRRQSQIKAKQGRKAKLAALRAKYRVAATPDAKKKIVDKVFRISPMTDEKVFLASVKVTKGTEETKETKETEGKKGTKKTK